MLKSTFSNFKIPGMSINIHTDCQLCSTRQGSSSEIHQDNKYHTHLNLTAHNYTRNTNNLKPTSSLWPWCLRCITAWNVACMCLIPTSLNQTSQLVLLLQVDLDSVELIRWCKSPFFTQRYLLHRVC